MSLGTSLRLELFVDDLVASLDFYTRVLGFAADEQHADGYLPLTRGTVYIALNRRAVLPEDHPIYISAQDRPGGGIEIVLEEDDLMAMYEHVKSVGWPLSADLMQQSWGLMDFRVLDPDGYYWRVTSRS